MLSSNFLLFAIAFSFSPIVLEIISNQINKLSNQNYSNDFSSDFEKVSFITKANFSSHLNKKSINKC